MTKQDLIVFNDTTFTLPETHQAVNTVICNALNYNQKLKRKGYVISTLEVDSEMVYIWLTGSPVLPETNEFNPPVPRTLHFVESHTPYLAIIDESDPYPKRFVENRKHDYSTKLHNLKHIYSLQGDPSFVTKLVGGLKRILEGYSRKHKKNLILLSFAPSIRFTANFIIPHIKMGFPMFANVAKTPSMLTMTTMDFDDAMSRKNAAMLAESLATTYNRDNKRSFVSHFTLPSGVLSLVRTNRRSYNDVFYMKPDTNDFIFDLSQVDYGTMNITTVIVEGKIQQSLITRAIKNKFKEEMDDFVEKCLSRLNPTT